MVGFKKTEIGLLPEDWNAIRIKEMYKLNNEQITQSNIPYNEFYYLDLSSVKNGVVTIPQEKIQIDEAPSRAKRVLMQNDVIIATVRPNLKGFAIANFETDSMICSTGFALVKTKNELDAKYLLQNLFSHSIANQIENLVVGSNYPAISNSDVENLIIPQPPLPEQQKIATILSKWDELIDTQTKLIAAKEKQKTSLMQKLLSDEVRFPGFSDEWKTVALGKVGQVINGLTYSPNDIHEKGVLVLRSSNVQNRRLAFKDNVYVNVEAGKFNPVQENDILICVRNGSQNLIGKNAIIDKANAGVAFGAFMTVYRSEFNPFFFHLFDTPFYNKEVYKNLGATINSINGSDLKKFKMPFPGIEEQKKITALLDSMNKEIKTLTDELESIKLQKKGLMQQLLTGRIRVKV